MFLTRLLLTAFGKFHGKDITLSSGLNLIYGPNEAGKSTICDFIEGMLYGFKKPDARRRTFNHKYSRYQPRLGQTYAGSLEYKTHNGLYRIERDFNNDRITIYDCLTGEDITYLQPLNPGTKEPAIIAQHWGLNYTAFLNTVSIDQYNNFSPRDMAKEVLDRWNNIVQSGQQDISVANAISRLNEMANQIGSDNAPTRPWAKAQQRLEQLRKEKDDVLERMNRSRGLSVQAQRLRQELNALYELKQKGIADTVEAHKDSLLYDIYSTLSSNRQQRNVLYMKTKTFNSLEQYIAQNENDPLEELLSLEKQINDIKESQWKYDVGSERQRLEIIKSKLKAINQKQIWYIAAMLVIIATAAIHPAFLGLLILPLYMLIRDYAEKHRITGELTSTEAQIQQQEEKLQELKTRYTALCRKKQQLLQGVGASDIQELMNMLKEKEALKYEIERLDNQYIAVIDDGINRRERELAALEASIDAILNGVRSLAQIEEEMYSIQKDLDTMALKKWAIKKASDVIISLSAQIQKDFSPILNKSASHNLYEITGGRYAELKISTELIANVEDPESGIWVNLEQLSGGTIDQTYLALRLSIADILTGWERLPFIIDDAFSHYDDLRLRNTLNCIGRLAQQRQVLLFTCHQQYKDILRELNIPFSYIEL